MCGPRGRDDRSHGGHHEPGVRTPERFGPAGGGHRELERRDRPAGPYDAGQFVERRAGVVHVAEQVRERERIERPVAERQPLRVREHAATGVRAEHLLAGVQRRDAVPAGRERARDQPRAARDVEDRRAGGRAHPVDEEPTPARVLSERQHRAHPLVLRRDASEQAPCVPRARRVRHAISSATRPGRSASESEDGVGRALRQILVPELAGPHQHAHQSRRLARPRCRSRRRRRPSPRARPGSPARRGRRFEVRERRLAADRGGGPGRLLETGEERAASRAPSPRAVFQ